MKQPRYFVGSVTGYSEVASNRAPQTSYSVYDRAYANRAVATFYPGQLHEKGAGDEQRRIHAEVRCAELNAKHEAWLVGEAA